MVEEIWDKYDEDHSGALDKDETWNFVQEYLGGSGSEIPLEQFDQIFEAFDSDKSGTIDKKEMTLLINQILPMACKKRERKNQIKDMIEDIWDKYDEDNSGALDKDETWKFVQEYLGGSGAEITL